MIVRFRRGDGIEFDAVEGSASFELMEKDGGFTRLDADGHTVEPSIAAEPSLADMTKKQLFEEAAKREVEVTDKMTKAQVIAAIEAKAAESETDPEGEAGGTASENDSGSGSEENE